NLQAGFNTLHTFVIISLVSICPPDGVTLDPFCGSGTTLAAAEEAGRRWRGIDIRQSQVDLSNKRIAEVQGLFAGA
ncbi:unnamed protein product, partial [marine sediment metagenome]